MWSQACMNRLWSARGAGTSLDGASVVAGSLVVEKRLAPLRRA